MTDNDLQPVSTLSTIEPLFDSAALRVGVTTLGRRLNDELGDGDPFLLALLGGSVVFLADLVRAIERPVRFELIHVGYTAAEAPATFEAGTLDEETPASEGGVLQIRYPLPVEIEGQNVVVLKDVVASGITEPYLDQQLRNRGARSVRFAALIDMLDERKTEFELDYSVFHTRRRGVLVGYGLKHGGRYGNLPYIGFVPEVP